MKRTLFTALLATALLHAADVSGRWDGPTEMKNQDGEAIVFHILLKQDGNKVSGGVWTEDHDEDNPRSIRNGTLDGTKLRFEVPQHADAVVTFELDLNGDTLNGKASFQGPNGPQEIKLSFKRLPVR
jgi:hypothetical protein